MNNIFLLILLIICLVVFIKLLTKLDLSKKINFDLTNINYHKCTYDHIIFSKEELTILKESYIKLYYFFESNNITFFAIGGTLIGAFRNGGLLPWDDDIDIGILEKDVDVIESFKDNEYYFETVQYGYKFKKKGSNIFIDIMVHINDDGKYHMKVNWWPKEYIYEHELFPLKKHVFSDLSIYIPNNSKDYLDRGYNGWDKEILYNCYQRHFNIMDRDRCNDIIYNEDNLCYSEL